MQLDFQFPGLEKEYTYTPLYYTTPVRVKYYDPEKKCLQMGMCYKDELFTSNGEIYLTDYIVKAATSAGFSFEDAVKELDWVSLNYWSKCL